MRITLATSSSSWRLCRVALFTVAVVAVFVTQVQAGENAATILIPNGGKVVEQGDGRLDVYDAKSNRVGYGIQRGGGSWDLFNLDGTRRATITPGIAGQPPRVTVPKGKR